MVFSVPLQGFEFEKSLMQKHFNNDKFLDTKQYPDAKLKAKITNLESIDFDNVTLADYGIEFKKGKPASNIAETVEVTVQAEYQ